MKPAALAFLLILTCVEAAEVDKLSGAGASCNTWKMLFYPCRADPWLKRMIRQDDMGPFWANRGKKDPSYLRSRLYAEEPRWILMRRAEDAHNSNFDPFFTTRGKKERTKGLE